MGKPSHPLGGGSMDWVCLEEGSSRKLAEGVPLWL